MSEIPIPKIEKEDIIAPQLESGGTAIVLQRHERYQRDRSAEDAGSIFEEHAEAALQRDEKFFEDILAQETDGAETMVLFVSSDTQYAGKGHRSLETAEVAQQAAIQVMERMGIDPMDRIINLNPDFRTSRSTSTDQDIRPFSKLREPQIFETPVYVDLLREKYGAEDGPGTGISQKAWAIHEMDGEKEVREELGAEGVYDVLGRTQKSVKILQRYAKAFHAKNPDKRLVVWSATHYDTISPLVKDATEASFEEYLPVDYGAGVVIEIEPDSKTPVLKTANEEVPLRLD